MIRIRKYRIFLAVTLCCLLAVYLFSRGTSEYSPDNWTGLHKPPVSPQRPLSDTSKFPHADDSVAPEKHPQPDAAAGRVHPRPTTAPEPPIPALAPAAPNEKHPTPEKPTPVQDPPGDPAAPQALPAAETSSDSVAAPGDSVHWTPKDDAFPVAPEHLIKLPTGAPKAIPRIQYVFEAETETQKANRQSKLDGIKTAFRRTWDGYRQHAWMKDELRPFSGGYHTKFGGWAATLVDSLDTLWIMGMRGEFEEAVAAASKIDFTTSDRPDIPLFETTIRYLGGLIGAYDVSGGTYKILLDKAVELAEVLMGAFDTPNRMPLLYYYWAGNRTENPMRSGSNVVLAELGSLSVEFTRLAQLTNNAKYYDAVARITNELEKFQSKTQVPGLWPLSLNAEGCAPESEDKHPHAIVPAEPTATPTDMPGEAEGPDPRKDSTTWGVDRVSTVEQQHESVTDEEWRQKDKTSFGNDAGKIAKRQTHDDADSDSDDYFSGVERCAPGGLEAAGFSRYSIGGEADSAYEYLPKEYLLLGGLNDQYRTMYISAVEAIKENLMYRPMIEDEKRELLFTGKFLPEQNRTGESGIKGSLDTGVGHLTCFQGGMFALAAVLFDRKAELEMAKKLADGCAWAYESSASGIMPEDLTPVKCPSLTDCPWNETTWWREIDPDALATTTKTQEVESRIAFEGLWPGIKAFGSTSYLLRPEAIESVWYMYRITGDESWREKGWKMFQAVETATKVQFGNSAVRNVVFKNVVVMDEMESFWTAETLKYFYLLFSEPDVISLDDFVLNTEAHPFLRPDSKKNPS